MTNSRSAFFFVLLLLIPATVYVLAIVAYPLIDTINLSFTNAGLPRTYKFVGWDNYAKIFNDTFGGVIGRTFIWSFFSVLFFLFVGSFGAVLFFVFFLCL